MKLKIELTKKQVVKALGKGYREAQIAEGNGGFKRQTNVVKSKKVYDRNKFRVTL